MDQLILCISYTLTHWQGFVVKTGLSTHQASQPWIHRCPPASASWVLGLELFITTLWKHLIVCIGVSTACISVLQMWVLKESRKKGTGSTRTGVVNSCEPPWGAGNVIQVLWESSKVLWSAHLISHLHKAFPLLFPLCCLGCFESHDPLSLA